MPFEEELQPATWCTQSRQSVIWSVRYEANRWMYTHMCWHTSWTDSQVIMFPLPKETWTPARLFEFAGRRTDWADPPPPAALAGRRYAKCAHQTERTPEHYYDNAGSHVHMCVHCGNKKISSPVCRQRNSCMCCCARVTKFNLCPRARSSGAHTRTWDLGKNISAGQTKRLLDDV